MRVVKLDIVREINDSYKDFRLAWNNWHRVKGRVIAPFSLDMRISRQASDLITAPLIWAKVEED